jgi:hypothetical protein
MEEYTACVKMLSMPHSDDGAGLEDFKSDECVVDNSSPFFFDGLSGKCSISMFFVRYHFEEIFMHGVRNSQRNDAILSLGLFRDDALSIFSVFPRQSNR